MSPRLQAILDALPDSERSFVQLTRLVPLAAAAAYLHMTAPALRSAIRRGAIRAHKVEGRLHLGDSELERFRAARMTMFFESRRSRARRRPVPVMAETTVRVPGDDATAVRPLVSAGSALATTVR